MWFYIQTYEIRPWSLLVTNMFSSAVKITFVAIELVSGGHLLFPLCSYQAAGHESAELNMF